MAKKTRVEFKNINKTKQRVKAAFTEFKNHPDLLNEIGQFSVDRIVQQTSLGKSLPENGRLPSLEDSTKNIRRALKKMNPDIPRSFSNTSKGRPVFNPDKSNLTLSGQLLGSLTYKINTRGTVDIFVKGRRKPIKTFLKDGKVINNNPALARDLAKRGFSFIGLDEKAEDRIARIVVKFIRKQLALKKRLARLL